MPTHKNNLPPNAKLAFKGKIFDVYQWEQKMYNGSTEIFEKLKRPDTAVVIPVVKDKILVLEQMQPDRPLPFMSLPGGRFEENEYPLDAAKRELLEETGYTSTDWKLWQVLQPFNKTIWTVHVYIARNCLQEKNQKLDAGEKISLKSIDFESFLLLSEDTTFAERELVPLLYHLRLHKNKREVFKKLLFRK